MALPPDQFGWGCERATPASLDPNHVKESTTMSITHHHGHPDLAGRLARIEQRGTRHRAAAVVICFCLPALAAVSVAVAAVLSPASPAGSPAPGTTAVETVAP